MLYNKKKERVKQQVDCMTCPYFDKSQKKCNGLGKNCFEYDPKTRTAIDPVTKLSIRIDKI